MALICFFTVSAETVSQKQAQQLAHLFFNEAAGKVTAPPKLIYNGRKLTTNRLFTPFYVYNTPVRGFVIISAENKAFPILGFSLKDSFDPEKLGEGEIELLRSYAREIELVRYDSEPLNATLHAWQNYPEYVNGILTASYQATDPKFTVEEAGEMVEAAVKRDDAFYSDLYTPQQWQESVEEELAGKESVAVILISQNELYPMVIYGRQGNYFRIQLNKRNSWLMRLNATEIIPSDMVAASVPLLDVFETVMEEEPFAFNDAFVEEVGLIEENRKSVSSIDMPVYESKPRVIANGGGHFDIMLPENVVMSTVYNLSGALIGKYTYKNNPVAHIDISAEPSGFYFLTLTGESGTPYGIKIYR